MPYSAGVRTRWSRLAVNVATATSPATPRAAPAAAVRVRTPSRTRPGSFVRWRPSSIDGGATADATVTRRDGSRRGTRGERRRSSQAIRANRARVHTARRRRPARSRPGRSRLPGRARGPGGARAGTPVTPPTATATATSAATTAATIPGSVAASTPSPWVKPMARSARCSEREPAMWRRMTWASTSDPTPNTTRARIADADPQHPAGRFDPMQGVGRATDLDGAGRSDVRDAATTRSMPADPSAVRTANPA